MSQFGVGYGGFAAFAPFMIILALWSLFWKGLALWHAAHRNEPWWFVALLVINTAGILELVYLFGVAKIPSDKLFHKSR
ncbi:hypothetical protein KBD59_04065 [Candidatus Gracilibacteria bacterium]|nr:hypothetical protein [Candidatus Gracilibacteria bacterium]